MKIPKELIKEYVKSEKFTNTTDIMDSIKSMFADVLNEVLQCELDEQLGYDKHARTESGEKKNYRNGSTRTGILLSVSLKSCMRIERHKSEVLCRGSATDPEVYRIGFPGTGKRVRKIGTRPPVSICKILLNCVRGL